MGVYFLAARDKIQDLERLLKAEEELRRATQEALEKRERELEEAEINISLGKD
jgi:hypothetical protein